MTFRRSRLLPLAFVLVGVLTPAVPAAAADPVPTLPCVDVAGVQVNCPAPAPAPSPPAESKPEACADADLLPAAGNLPKINKATLCLVNRERTKRGLKAFKRQAALGRAATGFAKQLVRERFFDHTAPDGTTLLDRIKATNYLTGRLVRWSVGENIGYGTGELSTPASIVKAWMDSPGHRANILRATFRDLGLGVALGSPTTSRGATYVHNFGLRKR